MSFETEHWSSPNGCHPDCPACAAETHECPNCGWAGPEAALHEIQDFWDRVNPGEPMPAGQCPECGALCHAIEKEVNADPLSAAAPALLGHCERFLSLLDNARVPGEITQTPEAIAELRADVRKAKTIDH